jgi:hypothetical protein
MLEVDGCRFRNCTGEGTMRRLVLGLVGALLTAGLAGCGGSPQLPQAVERLPGKWQGQMIVYEEELQGKLPAEKIAELAAMKMDFEFRPDGTMSLSGVDQGRAYTGAGRWELVKQEGDLLTIKSTEDGNPPKDINIEFDGQDTFFIPLKTEVAELGAMRFTRLQ